MNQQGFQQEAPAQAEEERRAGSRQSSRSAVQEDQLSPDQPPSEASGPGDERASGRSSDQASGREGRQAGSVSSDASSRNQAASGTGSLSRPMSLGQGSGLSGSQPPLGDQKGSSTSGSFHPDGADDRDPREGEQHLPSYFHPNQRFRGDGLGLGNAGFRGEARGAQGGEEPRVTATEESVSEAAAARRVRELRERENQAFMDAHRNPMTGDGATRGQVNDGQYRPHDRDNVSAEEQRYRDQGAIPRRRIPADRFSETTSSRDRSLEEILARNMSQMGGNGTMPPERTTAFPRVPQPGFGPFGRPGTSMPHTGPPMAGMSSGVPGGSAGLPRCKEEPEEQEEIERRRQEYEDKLRRSQEDSARAREERRRLLMQAQAEAAQRVAEEVRLQAERELREEMERYDQEEEARLAREMAHMSMGNRNESEHMHRMSGGAMGPETGAANAGQERMGPAGSTPHPRPPPRRPSREETREPMDERARQRAPTPENGRRNGRTQSAGPRTGSMRQEGPHFADREVPRGAAAQGPAQQHAEGPNAGSRVQAPPPQA